MESNKNDQKKTSLENSLINEVTGDNLKELTLEASEIILDSFLEEGFLKEIPFFGSFYKGGKALFGLREAIFAKKVYKFLTQFKDIPQQQRQQFIEKLDSNEGYRSKVGETLIVVLDRLDDMEKPEIIGNLFRASVKEQITYEDFLRLSGVVQKAFLPDLKKLKTGNISRTIQEQFVNIGIYSLELKTTSRETEYVSLKNLSEQQKNVPIVKFRINETGRKLLEYGLI